MLNFVDFLTSKVTNLILQGARSRMSDKEFLEKEIACWKNSPHRIMQIKGHLYYDNEHIDTEADYDRRGRQAARG